MVQQMCRHIMRRVDAHRAELVYVKILPVPAHPLLPEPVSYTHLFDTAQRTADDYLASVAAVKEEAEREAERIVNEAKEEAGRIIADAKKQTEER